MVGWDRNWIADDELLRTRIDLIEKSYSILTVVYFAPSPPETPDWTLGCDPPSHSPFSSGLAIGASMKWPGATRSGLTLPSNVGPLEE